MADKIECEIWLSMDEDGNWYVAKSADDAISDLGGDGGACIRTVKATVKMTPPEYHEVDLDIPDDAGSTTQVEAEAAA